MLRYLAGRIGIAIPTLLLASIITFLLIQLMPGNPGHTILGAEASPQQAEAINRELGLHRSLPEQYGSWLWDMRDGDLGASLFSRQPVVDALKERAPVTVWIVVGGTLLTAFVGIGLGVLAALRGGWLDKVAMAMSAGAAAVPNFWLALLLVLVFAIWLPLFPATGYTPFAESPVDWWRSLFLAVAAIALAHIASVMRQTRAAMLDELGREYVRTLQAAGVRRRSIVFKHVLRNASNTVVPTVGIQAIGILSGAVVVEQVFALPGLGSMTLEAVKTHDVPMIQGAVLFATALVLAINLIIDVLYYWLNPKVGRT